MGITQTRQKKSKLFEDTLKQFDIIDKQSNYVLFQNKTTMQKLEYWTFRYQDPESFKKAEKELNKNCSTLIHIEQYNCVTHEEFCSTMYELQILAEHPIQNLAQYLTYRGQQDFTTKELYHFLDCVALAQLNLDKKQYVGFTNLFQSENDLWKLCSFDYSYRPIDLWGKYPHLYPAPEELKQDPSIKYSQEKATVFTFGMLLLHLGLGKNRIQLAKSCDSLYVNNYIDNNRLQTRIGEFSKLFPPTLTQIIEGMLCIETFNRLSYIEIQNKLKESQQCKVTDNTNLLLKVHSKVPIKSPVETSRILDIPLLPEQPFLNSLNVNSINVNSINVNSVRKNDKLRFADGKTYQGEIMNDLMDGQGILYYSDGTVEYEGIFQNGQFHEFGCHNNQNPDIMDAFLDISQFPGIANYWVKYEGEFFQNKRHGLGTITFSNGDTYIGGFSKDQMQGRGTYSQKYGQVYAGFWEDSKLKY